MNIHGSPEEEITQIAIDGRMAEPNAGCLYNGTVLSHKMQRNAGHRLQHAWALKTDAP